MDMEAIVEPLRSLEGADDWGDIDGVESQTKKVLIALSMDRSVIREALDGLAGQPELLALAEHYDILDKIVLWDDPTGFRVRLHVFLPGYFDRPHNHRWSYASTILRGWYRHYLFGNVELDETVKPASLDAVMVREERVGDTYALHHSMVHAVVAERDCGPLQNNPSYTARCRESSPHAAVGLPGNASCVPGQILPPIQRSSGCYRRGRRGS
jgi:hypothetical protein